MRTPCAPWLFVAMRLAQCQRPGGRVGNHHDRRAQRPIDRPPPPVLRRFTLSWAAMLVLTRRELEALLEPGPLIEAVAVALADLVSGKASMPPRIAAFTEGRAGLLGGMLAYSPSAQQRRA